MSQAPAGGGGGGVPSWVFSPRSKILGIVVSWVVGGFLAFNDRVVEIIRSVGDVYADAFDVAGGSLVDGGRAAGDAILGVVQSLNGALLDLAGGAGFAGPIAAIVTFAIVAVASATLLRGVLWLLKWVT